MNNTECSLFTHYKRWVKGRFKELLDHSSDGTLPFMSRQNWMIFKKWLNEFAEKNREHILSYPYSFVIGIEFILETNSASLYIAGDAITINLSEETLDGYYFRGERIG